MQILPIYNLYENRIKPVFNIKTEKTNLLMTPSMSFNMVSFGRVAGNAEPLRELMEMGFLPDIWTGKFPIGQKHFESLLQRKEFNRQISTILKTVRPLKEKLHKVPLEIYNMLEEYAKIDPNAHLDEIFQQWGPLAQLDLKNIQDPIFEQLELIARELPDKEKSEFDALMKKTNEQRRKEPILQKFNRRDFRYKLSRIAQKIRQRNLSEEVSAINKIINMSAGLPQDAPSDLFSKKMPKKQKKHRTNKPDLLINIFQQMKNFYERSALKKDPELNSLFTDVNCQIHGRKIFIPFGRYNFIESIKQITKNLEDQSLAHRLIQKAAKLPTSTQEVSAFIVKASRQSSDKIGYDWLWGSVGNVDHIDLFCKGGRDGLSNYACSTNYTNSKRGNKTFAQQLRTNPETYATCQFYIDKLIEALNRGLLKKFGLNKAYIINFAKKLTKKSPPEKPLHLDLSKLN